MGRSFEEILYSLVVDIDIKSSRVYKEKIKYVFSSYFSKTGTGS